MHAVQRVVFLAFPAMVRPYAASSSDGRVCGGTEDVGGKGFAFKYFSSWS